MSHDPHAAYNVSLGGAPETPMTDAEAESLRESYLSHEGWLQHIGSALFVGAPYLVVGPFFFLAGLFEAISVITGGPDELRSLLDPMQSVLVGVLLFGMGAASCAAATGLRELNPRQIWLYNVVLVLWMLSCWVFLPLSVWAFYMVNSPSSHVVFSPEYREAQMLTRHMEVERPQTGFVIFLLLLGFPLALFCAAAG